MWKLNQKKNNHSMNSLTIKLKQHTPLIHFQHDQEGATLRASEVKPKLDKYILTQLGGGDYKKGKAEAKTKGWLVGKGDHPALDYKMRIEVGKLSSPKEYLFASYLKRDKIGELEGLGIKAISNTTFFAQEKENGKIREKKDWDTIGKKGLLWNDVTLCIFSLNNDLISCVQEKIANFFLCTNFGTRSDKGFGSFTVVSINEKTDNVPNTIEKYMEAFKTYYEFCYKRNSSTCIFSDIKDDYQRLKSGTNFGNYRKSLLFCYAVEKMKNNPRWEKRHFKQMMSTALRNEGLVLKANRNMNNQFNAPIADSNGLQNWRDKPKPYNYVYLRALLGLAESFEFQIKGEYDRAVVCVDGGDIKRFQSPLFFKVIDNDIYLLGNEPHDIFNKKFSFTYKIKKEKRENTLPISGDGLSTPSESDFSLANFLQYAIFEADKNLRLDYKQLF